MKFRAILNDVTCVQHLSHVLSALVKLSNPWTLKLSPNKFFFILNQRITDGGMTVWCELIQTSFFSEYAMEGVNHEDANEILLELQLEQLVNVLKTCLKGCQSVKLKLTNAHGPCMTVISRNSLSAEVCSENHVPITVIPRKDWKYFQEPSSPDIDASIYLPKMTIFKNVVDRMHSLHDKIGIHLQILSANHNGELEVCVDADLVTVKTHFKNLEHPRWSGDSQESQTRNTQQNREFHSVTVDSNKLLLFLLSEQLSPDKIACS
ncbi:DgyrCDS13200 [Dimorphilus gyrociliatus]|uniref:Checkpoint protein n=2 Tax=Dimorphilus gyrociliatus TaxID=2664684 RepID=A0A7I8WA10_9ANNE|nr:DgyrCDS13200 [Dimorphilus gyrociliatus]